MLISFFKSRNLAASFGGICKIHSAFFAKMVCFSFLRGKKTQKMFLEDFRKLIYFEVLKVNVIFQELILFKKLNLKMNT